MNIESDQPSLEVATNHWVGLIEALREYRERVGNPSYRELADRVAAARVARGVDTYAARVGKTTVYECFQHGRPRVNVSLCREVGLALGATPEQVEQWVRSCDKEAENETLPEEFKPLPITFRRGITVAALCLALSLLGRLLVILVDIPLHLDMMGTAVAAFVLGPWWAVSVGIATNLSGVAISGTSSIPFTLVQVVGALAWGYGIRRFRASERLIPYTLLSVGVAVACSLTAVPIVMAMTSWQERESFQHAQESFLNLFGSRFASLFFGNLLTSVIDKVLSAFVALLVIACLAWPYRVRLPLATTVSPRD